MEFLSPPRLQSRPRRLPREFVHKSVPQHSYASAGKRGAAGGASQHANPVRAELLSTPTVHGQQCGLLTGRLCKAIPRCAKPNNCHVCQVLFCGLRKCCRLPTPPDGKVMYFAEFVGFVAHGGAPHFVVAHSRSLSLTLAHLVATRVQATDPSVSRLYGWF